jgi:type VI secretion system FHA domain protein
MRLLLSMVAWPDGAKPDVRDIDAELAIGRGDESGWTLSDPNSRLSRRHCVLTPHGEGWRVTDLSLNGTYINDSTQPLGREQSHELHDGDQIRLGPYVIEVRHQASSALRMPPPRVPFEPGNGNPFDQAESLPPHLGGWVPPVMPGGGMPDARHDPDGFVGRPVADHSPAISDIWTPPPSQPFVLPDDFDPATAAPSGARPFVPANDPPFAAPIDPLPIVPSAQLPADWDPLTAAPLGAPAPSPPPPPLEAAAPPEPVPISPASAAPDNTLLGAFLRGAGLSDAGEVDAVTLMEQVGELVRLVVDRMRALQVDRAAIKREFRIMPTRVQLDDNNPIRFSASTDVALRALLTGKRKPAQPVGEVLDGIRLHELAMIAAMRDAVTELLETLNPRHVRGGSDGIGKMLPMQRKARAFDQYEALHAATVRALTDDFDSVFGKAFARAYERVALADDDAAWRQQR